MIYSSSFKLDQFAPIAVYDKLKSLYREEISLLFESAGSSEGAYSFILIGAKERLQYINDTTYYTDIKGQKKSLDITPFNFLKNYYKDIDKSYYQKISNELQVGYVDGFIGFIGYDVVKTFEPTLQENMKDLEDQINRADMDLILPKLVVVYSHKTHHITLISSMQEKESEFPNIQNTLQSSYEYIDIKPIENEEEGEFTSSKEAFFEMIDKSKKMIRSGDVFQILISNRYRKKAKVDPFSFYRVLRTKNPSPYMYLLEYEDYSIVGSSPEVMVQLQDNKLLLRPIAGTRKRGTTPQRDLELEQELLADPKELSEHLMLIDLGRNDVGRVAKVGSVQVQDMMHVERYSHVMHIVSDVVAELADDKDMFDLFAATFTAGTMTGAPKIRAMELIAEIEGVKRGFYTGSIGYFGFDGNMDSAITIRTALVKEDEIILHAGAGVVADSQPELEYLEVKNKLGALVSTLEDLKANS